MFQALLMSVMSSVAGPPSTLPNEPVASLDLQRYAGQWHEIAHLPMFFQRKCVDTITATYRLRPDGNVDVHNACRNKSDQMEASDGLARPVEGQPGALQVRFAPAWLAWLPMVWADYWVVEVDPDYQWAVVGGPSRKYMWILSRTPTMSQQLFQQLTERAAQRGYDIGRLVIAAPLRQPAH